MNHGISDIVVLEASDSPGGRTGFMSVAGAVLDAGAQFIRPEQESLSALLGELGLSVVALDAPGEPVCRVAPPVDHPQLKAFVDRLSDTVRLMDTDTPWTHPDAEWLDSMSVLEWAEDGGVDDPAVLGYLNTRTESMLSAPGDAVSALWFVYFVAASGGWEEFSTGTLSYRVAGGIGQIATLVGERLGDRLRTRCPVVRVDHRDESVLLTNADDSTVEAEHVVFACSPSELTRIEFEPRLPTSRRLLNEGWTMAGGMKFALAYRTPFWRDLGFNGQIIPDADTPLSSVWDNTPDGNGPGILMGLTSRRRFDERLPADPAERIAAIESYIAEAFGESTPKSIDYVEKLWGDEEWVSGCMSTNPPGSVLAHWSSIQESVDRLHFAGTETADRFNGYVEGAIRAGNRVADHLVAELEERANAQSA
ncbi:putative flavin-containing monoamine oxidase AofH [Gordonia spumicola]|uniref:Putative flavin-containing monoamine oxidase AofH n=2 Tax=Gordonia spumicola TaxID=589161 RepID=A0A7I9V5Q8_9ACTN|nr:putative flavin-containing monoamine oxidase AofH [Gordonia spumicola]